MLTVGVDFLAQRTEILQFNEFCTNFLVLGRKSIQLLAYQSNRGIKLTPDLLDFFLFCGNQFLLGLQALLLHV